MKRLDLFPDETSREQLAASDLASFAAPGSLDTNWHEAPNERRGGWSGVGRHLLRNGSGVFIKRQDKHLCRTRRHPLRGIPTFYREYHSTPRTGSSARRGAADPGASHIEDRLPGRWTRNTPLFIADSELPGHCRERDPLLFEGVEIGRIEPSGKGLIKRRPMPVE